MQPVLLDQLVALVWAHRWLALLALSISYSTTLLSPQSAFPISLSKRARVGALFALAFAGAGLTAFAASGSSLAAWAPTWALHGALASFLALGGYAAVVTVVFNGNPPAWLKALAFIAQPKNQEPPAGGSAPAVLAPLHDEVEDTHPGVQRSATQFAVAAMLVLGVGVGVPACAAFNTALHDMTPAGACLAQALADGGSEDPMILVSECSGAVIEDLIKTIADLLDNQPDGGEQDAAPDGGMVGRVFPNGEIRINDITYREAHLRRALANAYAAQTKAAQ